LFHFGDVSKAVSAQYLSELLIKLSEQTTFDKAAFREKLPRYILNAIAHVIPPSSLQPPVLSNGGGSA
jgi:hypothetical protein